MRARSLALAFAWFVLVLGCTQKSEPAQRLTSFTFRDQRGHEFTRADLTGQVWIADFVYTSCQSACPLLTSRLVALQQRLPTPSLRFVSFSVDPDMDTPDALARYAARWNPAEKRWALLSTNAAELAALTQKLRLELSRGEGDISHTNRFFLIDAASNVVASYDSSDDAEVEQLVSDVSRMLGAAPKNVVSGAGRELFAKLACGGCHDDAQLAPPLAGLLGTRVMFERGAATIADEAYLRESIATPEAKVVAGYPSSMPHYGSIISPEQLESLVSFVGSLPRAPLAGAAPTEAAPPETDPVCGMATRVTVRSPTEEYAGHRYHFCSLSCALRFRKDPARYSKRE